MRNAVTAEDVERAHRQWEEMHKWVGWLRDPNSAQYRYHRPQQREMMLRSFQEKAKLTRVTYEDLRDRFDRQNREPKEPELLSPLEQAMTLTSEYVQQRDEQRYRFLKGLYEVTGGRANVPVSKTAFPSSINLSPEDARDAFEWLYARELVCWLGQSFGMTQRGIAALEKATRGESQTNSQPFAPSAVQHVNNNFTFNGNVGAVQTGADAVANVQQNIGATPNELVPLLAALRSEIAKLPDDEREAASEAVDALEKETAKATRNDAKVKLYTAGLVAIPALYNVLKPVLTFYGIHLP